MKEFFLMLFFSKLIVLTPTSVDLTNQWLEIIPQAPLRAITSGAGIYIDVSEVIYRDTNDEKLEKLFPPGSIVVKLIDKKGYEFIMLNGRAYATSENRIELVLLSKSPIPTDRKFVKVLIKSKKRIEKVKVIWQNSSL